MFDEKYHDRSDALGMRLERLSRQMNPSPQLMKAAKSGTPLRAGGIKYTAGTHIRKFTKAAVAYAVGIALLLGAILLLPRLFGEHPPVVTQPKGTTAVTTTTTSPLDRDEIANPDQLTDLQIKAKEAIWAAIKDNVREDLTINDVAIGSFIVEYDEAIVCFFYGCPRRYAGLMFTEETVLDYQFRYEDTFQLQVFANGNSYSFGGAYAADVLTEEEIRTIWEDYKANNDFYYTPEADKWFS